MEHMESLCRKDILNRYKQGKRQMESRSRSIAKTLSWRFVATLITMIVAWTVTGEPKNAFAIGIADTLIKLFGFYFHERAWNHISIGKKGIVKRSYLLSFSEAGSQQENSGPVMLVLSACRNPHNAIDLALKKARAQKSLILVYVVCNNFAGYFVETDAGIYPALKKECENEIRHKYEEDARNEVDKIVQKSNTQGISVTTYMRKGSFPHKGNEIINSEKPSLIITRCTNKPVWLRKFLRALTGCFNKNLRIPVIEA